MSEIHYFQRYSQRENVATNNAMLLLSRLYSHKPQSLELLLKELADDPLIEIGASFTQQTRLPQGSVPDATISQLSVKIVIETKLHNQPDIAQLLAHLRAFGEERTQVLMSLTPELPSTELQDEIRARVALYNSERKISVRYVPATFEQLITHYEDVLPEYEYEMHEILEDFRRYCAGEALLPITQYLMRGVPCGATLNENLEFRLYYDPAERNYTPHTYIGLYKEKCIHAIGKVENVITADIVNSEVKIIGKTTPPTSDQLSRIKSVVPDAAKVAGYDIATGHKFFMVQDFIRTNFRKTSRGPMRGPQFFDLREVLGKATFDSVDGIAHGLSDKTW